MNPYLTDELAVDIKAEYDRLASHLQEWYPSEWNWDALGFMTVQHDTMIFVFLEYYGRANPDFRSLFNALPLEDMVSYRVSPGCMGKWLSADKGTDIVITDEQQSAWGSICELFLSDEAKQWSEKHGIQIIPLRVFYAITRLKTFGGLIYQRLGLPSWCRYMPMSFTDIPQTNEHAYFMDFT